MRSAAGRSPAGRRRPGSCTGDAASAAWRTDRPSTPHSSSSTGAGSPSRSGRRSPARGSARPPLCVGTTIACAGRVGPVPAGRRVELPLPPPHAASASSAAVAAAIANETRAGLPRAGLLDCLHERSPLDERYSFFTGRGERRAHASGGIRPVRHLLPGRHPAKKRHVRQFLQPAASHERRFVELLQGPASS